MANQTGHGHGKTRGYPEETPDSKRDAQKPDPKRPKNPDEGGMQRAPDSADKP